VNPHDGSPRTLYHAAFTELTRTPFASLEQCLDALLNAGISSMLLSRASVWLFEGDGAQIHCIRSVQPEQASTLAGMRIQRGSCPAYFEALRAEMVVDAGNAELDERTKELADSYLHPQGVRALLDAPVRIFGSQVGVLCLESTEVRDWQRADRNFAAALGLLVGLALEHAELVRARNQMQRSLEFDLNTGLANGHHFERALSLVLANGNFACGWVVRLEIAQYSKLRSGLSDAAMRELYRQIAERLRANVTNMIELAHAGDSEFCLVCVADDEHQLIADIRQAFDAAIDLEGQALLLTPVCGLRRMETEHVGLAAELMRDAETAMHEARDSGGDVIVHSPQLSAERQQALALEQSIRRAVQAREFTLLMQPMIDLATGRLVGLEALMRWRQADGSFAVPADFLQVLLDTGLIVPLGRELLVTALSQVAKLQRDLGRSDLGLSFNLSAPELMQPGLARLIRAEIYAQNFPRGQLAIELTESAVIADEIGINAVLSELREIGCRVHLDDFGTGYSSLNHMRQLPFDTIKIDRSFLRGALSSGADRRMIGMLVGLSRDMDRTCVAEGIEDSAHLSLAISLGAQIGQGYMIAKPMPIEMIDGPWLTVFEARCKTFVEGARGEGIA
jgi:EAL domain-containing protein (putative c-di-GMP-specific phosphodiesterase class I)/GGDEF domain-containing protein